MMTWMGRNAVQSCFIAFLISTLASSAFAFDGRRKGFILGFGLGPGLVSFNETYSIDIMGYSWTYDRENKFAVMTDFKIGHGFTNQVQVYWMSKVSWFGFEDETVVNGVGGLGITYFSQPMAPSTYIFGGLGFSTWSTPWEEFGVYEPEKQSTGFGFGLAGGVGQEFSRHWSFECNLAWGKPTESEWWWYTDNQGRRGLYEIRDRYNALSLRLTLNVLAY